MIIRIFTTLVTAIALLGSALAQTPGTVTSDTFGSGGNQFSIDFVSIGDSGNAIDPATGYGAVPYAYRIGKYTISQNQVNAALANGLQNVTSDTLHDAIQLVGTYAGPACDISWFSAAAYVNWLNTSSGYAPAYNIVYTNGAWSMAIWPEGQAWTLGGTNLFRNAQCHYFLPSDNEWYKAAYYDPLLSGGSGGYWPYTTGSSNPPSQVSNAQLGKGGAGWNNGGAGTNANTIVYGLSSWCAPADVTQCGGLSPYGTMGQGGNAAQWVETTSDELNTNPYANRKAMGYSYVQVSTNPGWIPLSSTEDNGASQLSPSSAYKGWIGFRVASVEVIPFSYSNSGTSLSITGFNGSGGSVIIPSTINGLPVTAIADSAFAGQSNITSLTIPNGVTSIGSSTFNGCTGLTGITLPDSVISMGLNVFSGCPNLTNVSTSDGLKTFLSQYASQLGLSAVAVNNFSSTTEIQINAMVATSLAGNAAFLSSLGTNSSFLGALSGQILATTNNYGLATKGDITTLSAYLTNTVAPGLQNSITSLAQQTSATNAAYVKAVATNTAFFSALATNPSFITTLSGQITGGSNSYGLATAALVTSQNGALSNTLNSSITSQTSGLSNVLSGVITNRVTGLSNALTTSITSQAAGVSNALTSSLATQGSALSNSLSNAIATLTAQTAGVSNALSGSIISNSLSLSNMLSGVSNSLTGTISNQVSGLSNTLSSSITSQTSGLSNALSSVITNRVTGLSNALATSITSQTAGVSNALATSLASQGTSLSNAMSSAIASNTLSLSNVLTGVISSQVSGLSNSLSGALASQASGLSNTLSTSIANQTSGLSNALATSLASQGSSLNAQILAVSNALSVTLGANTQAFNTTLSNALATLSNQVAPTNTGFVTALATNPVFLNALTAQIQNGSNNYGVAVKQSQSLNFPSIPVLTITPGKLFTNAVTSSAGLTPVIQSSGNTAVATVSNNVLTLIGSGSTTITASQSGNALWNPVTASQPLIVNKGNQTLTFSAIAQQTYVPNKKVTLISTSSAGLNTNTTYLIDNGAIGSISSNVVTLLGTGTATITATNSGNTYFAPAFATQKLIVK